VNTDGKSKSKKGCKVASFMNFHTDTQHVRYVHASAKNVPFHVLQSPMQYWSFSCSKKVCGESTFSDFLCDVVHHDDHDDDDDDDADTAEQ